MRLYVAIAATAYLAIWPQTGIAMPITSPEGARTALDSAAIEQVHCRPGRPHHRWRGDHPTWDGCRLGVVVPNDRSSVRFRFGTRDRSRVGVDDRSGSRVRFGVRDQTRVRIGERGERGRVGTDTSVRGTIGRGSRDARGGGEGAGSGETGGRGGTTAPRGGAGPRPGGAALDGGERR